MSNPFESTINELKDLLLMYNRIEGVEPGHIREVRQAIRVLRLCGRARIIEDEYGTGIQYAMNEGDLKKLINGIINARLLHLRRERKEQKNG
jgi:hypothetical protein